MAEETIADVVESDVTPEKVTEGTGETVAEQAPETVDAAPKEQHEETAETRGLREALQAERRKRQEAQQFVEDIRNAERQQAKPQAPAAPQGVPQPSQFDDYDEYQQALIDHRVQAQMAQASRAQAQQQALSAFQARVDKGAEGKPADFQERIASMLSDEGLPVTPAMAEVIVGDDAGPDLAYHLHANPQEMHRIARMAPAAQAAHLGRLAERISNEKVTPSGAPPPVKPVRASTGNAVTDPEKMSTPEWMRWRQKQLAQ